MTVSVALESAPCPLGCEPADQVMFTGRDRLHALPGEFAVVRCGHCGLVRTNPRPTIDAMGMYYPDSYGPYSSTRVDPGELERGVARSRRLFGALFDPKTHALPDLPPGRMLEIGCGSGLFLHRMARSGWQVEGLEASPSAAATARTLGHRVRTGVLETAGPPDHPYDLLVSWMVLEHLHDPIGALSKVAGWCAPGAWLVASVPDAGALEFRLFRDSWYALDVPRHLFHFTPATIRRVLQSAGWHLERVLWHDNPNNLLMSLRNHCLDRGHVRSADYLLDVALGRRHRRARWVLGKLLGGLRASGRMTVWARRADG